MIQLSKRLLEMEESATIAMSRKSRELKAEGKDIISLSLGEPDFFTPQFIKDAAKVAMDNNFTMYTPVEGYDDLRESISYLPDFIDESKARAAILKKLGTTSSSFGTKVVDSALFKLNDGTYNYLCVLEMTS